MKQGLRIVMHVDMDAFFAAVEERDNPRFAGMPIVVGADPGNGTGRGVVSTANYAARKYGIGSAQPIRQAWKLAKEAERKGEPPVIFLPGSWRRYSEASDNIMEIIRSVAPVMQQRSVDEAYADISHMGSMEAAIELAQRVKDAIYAAERLTCSIGVGPNKLVAKIASDYDKPNGLTVIDETMTLGFLAPLPVRAMPGVGPKTEQQLSKRGIHNIRDVQLKTQEELVSMLGSWGEQLYYKARGIDESPVAEAYERKSIGEQQTFPEDTLDAGLLLQRMGDTVKDVFATLKRKKFIGARTVAITVRFFDFETISSAKTSKKLLTDEVSVEREAIRLLLPFLDSRRNPKKKPIRLIGVRLEKLEKK